MSNPALEILSPQEKENEGLIIVHYQSPQNPKPPPRQMQPKHKRWWLHAAVVLVIALTFVGIERTAFRPKPQTAKAIRPARMIPLDRAIYEWKGFYRVDPGLTV